MCDKDKFEVCRLCLNSRGLLMNVFGENSKLQFMMEKTIEDLIDVKVVEDANYPWLVCSACMEKLTEFRLFKRRCAECLSVFYDRIREGCNPTATKEWIINGESLGRNRKEIGHDAFVSDNVDSTAAEVQDDMIHVKEEIDSDCERSCAPEKDIDLPMVKSMQESDSQWNGNDEAGNYDPLGDRKLHLSFNEEVDIKEECDVDIPQIEGCLGVDLLQEQDDGKAQNAVGNLFHKCSICNHRFEQKDILEAHMILLHPVKSEEIRSEIDAEAIKCTSDIAADVMIYNCSICLKAFSQKGKLKSHMLIHNGEKPYLCGLCLKGFKYKPHLRDHIRVHMGEKPYKCEICTRAFTMKGHLTEHRLTHSGTRPHKCEVCPKAFAQKANLKRHMLTHTDEKPHKCVICLKRFNHKQHLNDHIRVHVEGKPYKCMACSKTFATKGHLTKHSLTHSGAKPHECELCSKAFAQKANLKRHMLLHTGERPYECEICSKGFHQKQHLESHMLSHKE
ncbi:zinc finger protein 260-like [Hetaerina americana]|uniref:zinc finger protein 260-like n=1 Tax=Hetaerina americana TaxID=62018 RepID=UPI003A7F2728